MLEEVLIAAIAAMPSSPDLQRLHAILNMASKESGRGADVPEELPVRQQIDNAADILTAIHGNRAAERARTIAAAPDSTLFSCMVLAELRSRKRN